MPYRPPVFTDPTTGLTETFYERYDKEWQAALEAERTAAEEQRMRSSNLMDYARTFMGVKAEERAARQEETENFLNALAMANEQRRMEYAEAEAERERERQGWQHDEHMEQLRILGMDARNKERELNNADRESKRQDYMTKLDLLEQARAELKDVKSRHEDVREKMRDSMLTPDARYLLKQDELTLLDEMDDATMNVLSAIQDANDAGSLYDPELTGISLTPSERQSISWMRNTDLTPQEAYWAIQASKAFPQADTDVLLSGVLATRTSKATARVFESQNWSALEQWLGENDAFEEGYEFRFEAMRERGLFDQPQREKVKTVAERGAIAKAGFGAMTAPVSGGLRNVQQIAELIQEPGKVLARGKQALAGVGKAWEMATSPEKLGKEVAQFWGVEATGFPETETEEE